MNGLKIISFVILSLFLNSSVLADNHFKLNPMQHKKKVKFIEHLIDSIEWPSSNHEGEFYLCTAGEPSDQDDPHFLTELKVKRKEVKLLDWKKISEVDKKCDLIYITDSHQEDLPQIFKQYKGKPVLLVSDIEGFSRMGGHISFVKINEQFGAVVNTLSLSAAGLNFDISQYNEIIVQPEEEEVANTSGKKNKHEHEHQHDHSHDHD